MVIVLTTLSGVGLFVTLLGICFHGFAFFKNRPEWWNTLDGVSTKRIKGLKGNKKLIKIEAKIEANHSGHLHPRIAWSRITVRANSEYRPVLSQVEKPNWLLLSEEGENLKVAVGKVLNPSSRSDRADRNPFGKDLPGVLNPEVEIVEEAVLPNETIVVIGKAKNEHGILILRDGFVWRGNLGALRRHISTNTTLPEKLATPFLQYGGFFAICTLLLLSISI